MSGYLKLYERLSLALTERPVSRVCAWASVAIPIRVGMPSCCNWEPRSSSMGQQQLRISRRRCEFHSHSFLQESAFVQILMRKPGGSPPFLRHLLPPIWETRGHEWSLNEFRSPSFCGSQRAFKYLLESLLALVLEAHYFQDMENKSAPLDSHLNPAGGLSGPKDLACLLARRAFLPAVNAALPPLSVCPGTWLHLLLSLLFVLCHVHWPCFSVFVSIFLNGVYRFF